MPVYLPLPAHVIRRLTFGNRDELTELAAKRMESIKGTPCPRCKSAMHPYFHPTTAFSPDDPLPRTIGRCVDCELEWDPLSGLIIKTGNPSKMRDPRPIIRGDD